MSRWHKFTTSKRYSIFRKFILDRAGWRCEKCGRPGALELHHIRPLSDGGKAWDALNCMALCRSCHIEKTSRGNRREKSPTEQKWAALVDALADADSP